MSSNGKLVALLVIAGILIPNFLVIVSGREIYPFTNAPMYAHYVGPDTYLYEMRFYAVKDLSERQIFLSKNPAKNKSDLRLIRYFFKNIYCSVEPGNPFRFDRDTPEKFEARLTSFFRVYEPIITKEISNPHYIRFEIVQYNRKEGVLATHKVGHYNTRSKRFKHTWQQNH